MISILIQDRHDVPITKIQNISNVSYDEKFEGFWQASFSVENSEKMVTNLAKSNRITIYFQGVERWRGIIEEVKPGTGNILSVTCFSIFKMLKKRRLDYIKVDRCDVVLAEMIDLLNAIDDTGLRFGSAPLTNVSVKFQKIKFEKSLTDLAGMVDGHLFIDLQNKVHILPIFGEDLSGSVRFFYKDGRQDVNNLLIFSVSETSSNILNKVFATNDSGGSFVSENSVSQTKYGIMEEDIKFSTANDQTSLETIANDYVSRRGDESKNLTVNLRPDKFLIDDFSVGDFVAVIIKKGYNDISQNHRIMEKKYTVLSDGETIEISVTLSVNSLPQKGFYETIADMSTRIKQLENQ